MSQLFLVPHAEVKPSQDCIKETLFELPNESNEVWIIPTDHYGRNRTHFFIEKTEEDMYEKNNMEKEHSALLHKKIVEEIRPNYKNIKLKMIRNEVNGMKITKEKENNILYQLKDFLEKDIHNIIIFTSDLSHEKNKTTYDVLEKEKFLIEKIGKNEEITMEDINSVSACGKYNLYIFFKLCKVMGLYYEIIRYNNSQNMNFYWTNQIYNYLVFYLGIRGSRENTILKNIGFYLQFLCAYSRSLLIDPNVRIPMYRFAINNPIFITISEGNRTMACRGNFNNSNIIEKVKEISIKDLKEDNRERWGGTLEKNNFIYMTSSPNFKIEITILELKRNWRKIKSPIREPYFGYGISISDKKNITGIFLPSVWKDNPTWSVQDYIEELKGKGGITTDNYRIYQYYAIGIEQGKPIENIQYLETIISLQHQLIRKNQMDQTNPLKGINQLNTIIKSTKTLKNEMNRNKLLS